MMKKAILILTLVFASVSFADEVKRADLAGSWYPGSKEELSNLLEGYIRDAQPEKIDGEIFALISPHAGYAFSGPVAGYSFKAAQAKSIKTVIVIGFSHRKFFDGISVYDRGSFETPLGRIEVDSQKAREIIAQDKRILFNPDAFKAENSVEMQIPFIQASLKGARIVPIAFGTQSFDDAEVLAKALANVLKGKKDFLIVASTDMSHYHPYEKANSIDRHAIALLSRMKARELYDEAQLGISEFCGIMPVAAVLLAAEKSGYDNIKILKYANSGDTFGSKESVVGYLSAAIYRDEAKSEEQRAKSKEGGEANMLNESQRKRLLQIARESITSFVRDGKTREFQEDDPVLNRPLGAFVTLHEKGELRGCIGCMTAQGPLYQSVANMAVEAATADPRFPRLSPGELDEIDIEISVLSPLKKVSGPDEIKIPGHGVVIRRGFRGGVYLPQVATETGWNKEEFLTSLCGHKSGLPPDAWKDPATEIYVFTAEVFGERKGEGR